MTALQSFDFDDDIRAVSPDRLVPAPARVIPFTPKLVLTERERWNKLCAVDPRSAAMLQTAFRKLYALHFPDE